MILSEWGARRRPRYSSSASHSCTRCASHQAKNRKIKDSMPEASTLQTVRLIIYLDVLRPSVYPEWSGGYWGTIWRFWPWVIVLPIFMIDKFRFTHRKTERDCSRQLPLTAQSTSFMLHFQYSKHACDSPHRPDAHAGIGNIPVSGNLGEAARRLFRHSSVGDRATPGREHLHLFSRSNSSFNFV